MDSRAATDFKIKYDYRFAPKSKNTCDKCKRHYKGVERMICNGRTESECSSTEYPVTFTTYENHTCKRFKRQ